MTLDRKKIGARSRRNGHSAELYYVHKFKDLGMDYCCTSRLGSRQYDNAKIDLMNLPYNVQVKYGVQKSMNPGKELFNMKSMIEAVFLPKDEVQTKCCILIHKKPAPRGKSEEEEYQLVYMTQTAFNLFKKDIPSLEFISEKISKNMVGHEYGHIVCITFSYFIENIFNYYKNSYLENYGKNH